MKTKIFILVLTLLLLSGCSVNYNLDFNGNEFIEESFIGNLNKDSDEYKYWLDGKNLPIPAFYDAVGTPEEEFDSSSEYHKQTVNEEQFSLKYTYNMQNFKDVYSGNLCYEYFKIFNGDEEKQIGIATSKEFLCFSSFPNLDEVTINIKTNHKVISHNADEVKKNKYKGDIYSWNITKDNADNKPINIVFSKNYQKTNPFLVILIVSISLMLILFIVGIFLIKHRRNNKF